MHGQGGVSLLESGTGVGIRTRGTREEVRIRNDELGGTDMVRLVHAPRKGSLTERWEVR